MADEKPKDEKPNKEGEQIVEVYRCLDWVVLTTDGNMYPPGTILDLSHLPDKSIQRFLKKGLYELAEGEPANVPQPLIGSEKATGRKRRPCCK